MRADKKKGVADPHSLTPLRWQKIVAFWNSFFRHTSKKKKKGCYPGVICHHSAAKVRVTKVLPLTQKIARFGVIKVFTNFLFLDQTGTLRAGRVNQDEL